MVIIQSHYAMHIKLTVGLKVKSDSKINHLAGTMSCRFTNSLNLTEVRYLPCEFEISITYSCVVFLLISRPIKK